MKIDVKKQIGTYTAPRGAFEVVTVPAMQFLMSTGTVTRTRPGPTPKP